MIERAQRVTEFLAADPIANWRSGETPHCIIHRDVRSCVRYCVPAATAEVELAPVFISMPLINTWTVFDLLPGRSVVQALTEAGVPVYLLDWGRRGAEDKYVTAGDLILRTLHRSIDRSRRHAGRSLQGVGYCVGGTFLAAYASVHPEAFDKIALVATPIDFHASGRLNLWADPENFPVDLIVDGWGNFPADLLKTSFDWLRPSTMTRKYKSLWDRIDTPGFTDIWTSLEKWSADAVDFPGEAYREYVKRCYFGDALMDGSWVLDGQPVDLGNIGVPVRSIAASTDHIVPPAAAHAVEKVWGGDVDTVTIRGGHVGICIGSRLPKALVEWVSA